MDRAEAIEILAQTDVWDDEAQEAFDMAIAALREQEQSQWISVKERLPETYYQEVLVYDEIDASSFIAALKSTGEWLVPQYEEYEFKITHWMPLPEPPKGEI